MHLRLVQTAKYRPKRYITNMYRVSQIREAYRFKARRYITNVYDI